MQGAGYSPLQTPSLKVISEAQIDEFLEAGFIILERTGVKVGHPEALKLLGVAVQPVQGIGV